MVNGRTAWQMLHCKARVEKGQTIVVHGANGGVGGILVQLARHAGLRIIGTAPATTTRSGREASNRSTTTTPMWSAECGSLPLGASTPSSITSEVR